MALNYKEQIELKDEEIKNAKENLIKRYENLGKNVASFVNEKKFDYCLDELSSYEIVKDEYERLLNKQNKLLNNVDSLNDCKKNLHNLSKLLEISLDEENKELSRLGAAIYEAYSNNQLCEEINSIVEPIFKEKNNKLNKFKNINPKSNISILNSFYTSKINKHRNTLLPLFNRAASVVIKEDLLNLIKLANKDKYLNSINEAKSKTKKVEKEIEQCKNEIDTLKKVENPTKQLEELKKEIDVSKKSVLDAAILLGEELYNKLPNNITSQEIGALSIEIIDDITLEFAKIESLEKEKIKLNNEVIITELSAQISHERNTINKLNAEIVSCNNQIKKIEKVIEEKRLKIIELKKEGTFEKTILDLKSLDGNNANI